MRKIIVSMAAAGVLVAGAFVASTLASSEASAQTDEPPVVAAEAHRPAPGGILDEVLGDLVEDGTLTQGQADAVKDALVAKHDEFKEKFGDRMERRDRRHRAHHRISEWLEDGVISADELAELPEDSRIFADDHPLAEALEDGQITQAEWDEFVEQRMADREARREARRNADDG